MRSSNVTGTSEKQNKARLSNPLPLASRDDPLYYNPKPCFDVALLVAGASARTFAKIMKRRNAHLVLFVGMALSFGFVLYCGSALRPFLISPDLITDANVPSDAIPEAGKQIARFRMGQRPRFTLDAYLEMLRTPSRHKVRDVVTRYPMEDAVLVQDLNAKFEVALLNLGGKWVEGPSGPGLNTAHFRGKAIGEQAAGADH